MRREPRPQQQRQDRAGRPATLPASANELAQAILPWQRGRQMRRQNVQFEQLIFPDEIHDLLLWKNWVSGYKAGAEFLNRKLNGVGQGNQAKETK